MLDKKICKGCREKSSWWNDYDDRRWTKGNVVCVLGNITKRKRAEKENAPPDWCAFTLEHVLKSQRVSKGAK